jgi:TRAP-type C4-dicarboxylate transport system permease small subunit
LSCKEAAQRLRITKERNISMTTLKIISDSMTSILKISGMVSLSLIVAMIFFNILARLFFSTTFGITEEWTVWLMIWSVFTFIGVDLKENEHISVDFLADKLRGKQRLILNVFISLIMVIFGVLFLYGCWSDTLNDRMIHVSTITSIPVPLWIVKLCMPLGMFLFLFYSVEKLIHDISMLRGGVKC